MVVKIPFNTVTQLESAVIVEDAYLTGLLKQFNPKNAPAWLEAMQKQAADWVLRLRLPHKKDEEWRFTDLSALVETNFVAVDRIEKNINLVSLPETAQSRIVFVNGCYVAELSDLSRVGEGIFVGNLAQLPQQYQNSIQNYLTQQQGAQEVFTALNTAGFEDVAIVWIPANIVSEVPIHLIFNSLTLEQDSFSLPRILVVAERGSSLSLIEEYVGTGDRAYFTNAVTEIWIGENARVNHTRIQQESDRGVHIAKTAISQARDSHYTCNEITFGGKLSRHNLEILQQGEQTETNLNGLTVIGGEQTADTHSIIALTKPQGTTNQLHKCIVGDRAHGIFSGKVFVPKEAQLTNATQLNRNLLLSSKARVDTKPELQITADNVKCSHGATVSQLEADEVFYLRSRGLNDSDARHLLIDAFAAEIIDRISIPSLRNLLLRSIADKVDRKDKGDAEISNK